MGSEAGLRSALKGKLKGICHYVRVENTCETGTPDVNLGWADGHSAWVELKYLSKFPVKSTTKISLECYTRDQMLWLMTRWCVKPGGSWLFVQVGVRYYLFRGRDCGKLFYGVNNKEFNDLAYLIMDKGWAGTELLHNMGLSL